VSLALLAVLTAYATPIVSVGEPTNMGISCACHWARVFPREDGLVDLFLSGGGNYTHVPLERWTDGSWRATGSPRGLTSIGELVDHAITPCPDGTWLHVASANRTEALDDSFYMIHYSAELDVLTEQLAVDSDTVLRYNDAPLVCDTRTVATVGHPRDLLSHDGVLLQLSPDGQVAGSQFFDTIPPVGGSSLIWDPTREAYLSFRGMGEGSPLVVVFLDEDFQQAAPWKEVWLDLPYVSWPQSVIRLGDGYAVAHLVRREGMAYGSDSGEIQVTVLDANLDLLQTVTITEVEPSSGAHRPSLARVGDELLVTYEVEIQPRLVVLQLDPDLPPEPDPETGIPGWVETDDPDTGESEDSGTPTDSGTAPTTPDAASHRPLANAGPDRTVALGTPVQLDGRASSHPSADPLSYVWTFTDPSLTLTDADQPVAVFEPGAPGTYTFTLVVTADGAAATDDVVVTVSDGKGCGCTAAPVAPVGLLPLILLVGRRRASPHRPPERP